jgi:hypothetical protein
MTTRNDTTAGGGDSTDGERPTSARRRLALPGGVVLALCIFLPALRVCGSPTYPITMPPFWSPYVLGALVAVMAIARTPRGLRATLIAVAVIYVLNLIGWGVVTMSTLEGAPIGLGMLVLAGAFIALTRRGELELRAAHATLLVGLACTPWFALLAFDPDGMWGAWVSLGASLALVIAGLEWRRQVRLARTEPVPRAIARDAS